MAKDELTPKQERFVAEYLVKLNATQAAILAGYSEKTADQQGSRLLTNVKVQAAIAAKQAVQLNRVDLQAEDVLRAIARHVKADGHADVRDLVDAQGNLKNLKDLPDHAAISVAGFDVVKRNLTSGDGKVDKVIKVRMRDHSRYVELAAKHFALLTDQVNVTMTRHDELRARLAEGRAHAAALSRAVKEDVVEGQVVQKTIAAAVAPETDEAVALPAFLRSVNRR